MREIWKRFWLVPVLCVALVSVQASCISVQFGRPVWQKYAQAGLEAGV